MWSAWPSCAPMMVNGSAGRRNRPATASAAWHSLARASGLVGAAEGEHRHREGGLEERPAPARTITDLMVPPVVGLAKETRAAARAAWGGAGAVSPRGDLQDSPNPSLETRRRLAISVVIEDWPRWRDRWPWVSRPVVVDDHRRAPGSTSAHASTTRTSNLILGEMSSSTPPCPDLSGDDDPRLAETSMPMQTPFYEDLRGQPHRRRRQGVDEHPLLGPRGPESASNQRRRPGSRRRRSSSAVASRGRRRPRRVGRRGGRRRRGAVVRQY